MGGFGHVEPLALEASGSRCGFGFTTVLAQYGPSACVGVCLNFAGDVEAYEVWVVWGLGSLFRVFVGIEFRVGPF